MAWVHPTPQTLTSSQTLETTGLGAMSVINDAEDTFSRYLEPSRNNFQIFREEEF